MSDGLVRRCEKCGYLCEPGMAYCACPPGGVPTVSGQGLNKPPAPEAKPPTPPEWALERAREMVARWEHGDEAHRQWLRDIAVPQLAHALTQAHAQGVSQSHGATQEQLRQARAEGFEAAEAVIEAFDVADADFSPQVALSMLADRVRRLKTCERQGRFIQCRGCPTVECTCMTELEVDLLEKNSALHDEVRALQPGGGEKGE